MPLLDLGALDFTKPLSDGGEPVGWRLLAYLSWPTNQQRRDEFLATVNAKSLAMLQDSPPPEGLQAAYPGIPADGLNGAWEDSKAEVLVKRVLAEKGQLGALADAPGLGMLIEETGKNTPGWMTAGHILFMVYMMDKFHASDLRGGASVSKAVELLEHLSGGTIPKNRKDIMNCWSEFKPVSHLGAALNFLSAGTGGDAENLGKCFNEAPGPILSIARVFQEFGLGFKAHGQSVSILPADTTWTIPDNFCLPQVDLNLTPLSSANLEILKKYQAPIKT